MEFERVIRGLVKYIERYIYPGMTDWQEVLAGTVVDQIYDGREELKKVIHDNHMYRMILAMDHSGNIDIDALADKLKRRIEKKGKIEVTLKLMPKLTFTSSDIDEILSIIKE